MNKVEFNAELRTFTYASVEYSTRGDFKNAIIANGKVVKWNWKASETAVDNGHHHFPSLYHAPGIPLSTIEYVLATYNPKLLIVSQGDGYPADEKCDGDSRGQLPVDGLLSEIDTDTIILQLKTAKAIDVFNAISDAAPDLNVAIMVHFGC